MSTKSIAQQIKDHRNAEQEQEIQIFEKDLRAFQSVGPDMADFLNSTHKNVKDTLDQNLNELKGHFSKLLAKLFMPKAILDIEKLFNQCTERIEASFEANKQKFNEKLSEKLEKFREINEKVLVNFSKMAVQNQEFSSFLQDQIDQYMADREQQVIE